MGRGRPPKPANQRKNKDVRVLLQPAQHDALTGLAAEIATPASEMGRALFEALLLAADRGEQADAVLARMVKSAAGEGGVPTFLTREGRQLVQLLGYVGLSNDFEVQPSEPDRWIEVPPIVRVPSPSCYLLIGRGDSMTTSGSQSIPDGSHILFCPSPTPKVGDIVHLEWNNSQSCSVKKFSGYDKSTGTYRFMPLNPAHEPLELREGEVEVRGVRVHHWIPGR